MPLSVLNRPRKAKSNILDQNHCVNRNNLIRIQTKEFSETANTTPHINMLYSNRRRSHEPTNCIKISTVTDCSVTGVFTGPIRTGATKEAHEHTNVNNIYLNFVGRILNHVKTITNKI